MEDYRRLLRKSVWQRPAPRVLLLALVVLSTWANDQPAIPQWSRATPASAIPSPRVDAPVAYDPVSKQVFMFGGLDASSTLRDTRQTLVTGIR